MADRLHPQPALTSKPVDDSLASDPAVKEWNSAIQKAAAIAHSGVEAYGAKMRGATDKKEKRDWQSMLMAAVDIEHAILALLKEEK
jgi:hypothetical protein